MPPSPTFFFPPPKEGWPEGVGMKYVDGCDVRNITPYKVFVYRTLKHHVFFLCTVRSSPNSFHHRTTTHALSDTHTDFHNHYHHFIHANNPARRRHPYQTNHHQNAFITAIPVSPLALNPPAHPLNHHHGQPSSRASRLNLDHDRHIADPRRPGPSTDRLNHRLDVIIIIREPVHHLHHADQLSRCHHRHALRLDIPALRRHQPARVAHPAELLGIRVCEHHHWRRRLHSISIHIRLNCSTSSDINNVGIRDDASYQHRRRESESCHECIADTRAGHRWCRVESSSRRRHWVGRAGFGILVALSGSVLSVFRQ